MHDTVDTISTSLLSGDNQSDVKEERSVNLSRWVLPILCLTAFANGQAPVKVLRVDPHAHLFCHTETGDPWSTCLTVTYRNLSTQPITGIRFEVQFINGLKEAQTPITVSNLQKVKPGKSTVAWWADGVYWKDCGEDKMDATVSVIKIMFADGTFWEAPAKPAQ